MDYPTGMLVTDLINEVAMGVRGGKRVKPIRRGSSNPPLRGDALDGVRYGVRLLRQAGSMLGTARNLLYHWTKITDMVVLFLWLVSHFFYT